MTNLSKFTAQQLTKKQMNKVTGGQGIVGCADKAFNVELIYRDVNNVERRVYGCGDTTEEA